MSGQYQTKDEFYRSFPETSFQLENRQVLKKSDIQRLYAPKFIYVEEIDHFEPLGDIALDTAIQRNLYSMNEVNRLRMEWEKKHQCDYDKVIFVSPNQRIKPSYLDSIQDDKTSHNMIHSLLLETHSLSSITFAFGVTSVMTLYGAIWKFIKGLKTNKLAPYVDFSRIIDYYLFIYGLSVNILDVGFSKTNSNTIDYTDSLLNDIFRHEDKKQFYYFFHQYVRELVKNYLERGQLFKAQALIHKLEEHPLASQWFGTFHRATYLIDHYLDQPGINEFKSVCAEREQCSLLYPS